MKQGGNAIQATERAAEQIAAEGIGALALLGDRRSGALAARDGSIVWYCPERFDRPALFAGLLDAAAGAWRIDPAGCAPGERGYLEQSGVLESHFVGAHGHCTVTDWMAAGEGAPSQLLVREFSASPAGFSWRLAPRPDYARRRPRLERSGEAVVVDRRLSLQASHRLLIDGDDVTCVIPRGESGWAVLGPSDLPRPTAEQLRAWRAATLEHWRGLAQRDSYVGPYEEAVKASLRAIRLLCHEDTGGIVAAASASLPETPGGSRNWDYRYVWLRDTGMIVSALTRLGGSLREGQAYLDFICGSRGSSHEYPLAVFTTLDGKTAPEEEVLELGGFLGSRPVRIGNAAGSQFQLDAFANVILAAKLIYARTPERPHWVTIEAIADFIAARWREPDHGIWEEPTRRPYTAGKVIAACALDSIAQYSEDERQALRWRAAVSDIRTYVARHCLTSEGAYAVYPGSEAVDVSAALFPIWGYTPAGAPEMRASIAALEREYRVAGGLFRRHLECADSREEGAFLAGSLWVAQYWIMRGELDRARAILDAVLACANDLGLLAEEADAAHPRLLGNFPQAFVHAALIGAAIDLKGATT